MTTHSPWLIEKDVIAAAAFSTLYPHLNRVAIAMATFEGAFRKDTLAWRSNNPGNLRASKFSLDGNSPYSTFRTYFKGYFALMYDLWLKCSGYTGTSLSGESTLKDLIYVWAPPSDDNNTEAYLRFVVEKTNFPEDFKLKRLLLS